MHNLLHSHLFNFEHTSSVIPSIDPSTFVLPPAKIIAPWSWQMEGGIPKQGSNTPKANASLGSKPGLLVINSHVFAPSLLFQISLNNILFEAVQKLKINETH